MITIFSTPKTFKNDIGIIQRDAILSWKKLRPQPEIILLGDDAGVAEAAQEFQVLHIRQIKKSEFGTPLVDDIFEKAQKIAKNRILAYVNADIILMGDFVKAVESIKEEKFLMVGRRSDLNVKEPINFQATNWEKKLKEKIIKEGKLHGPSGIDYFVFPRGLWHKIPSLALGRTCWDNWLMCEASSLGASLIDATPVVTALHQNHTYSHHREGKVGVWKGKEAEINLKLSGGDAHFFTIRDADLILTPTGLKKPKITIYRILSFPFRCFKKIPALGPLLFPGWLLMILWRKLKRLLT